MDPEITWRDAIDTLCQGEYYDSLFHLEELQEWLGKGGFRPEAVPPIHLLERIAGWVHELAEKEDKEE